MKKCVLFLLTLAFLAIPYCLLAQGTTAFTYQGQLLNSGQPANGFYDFQFALSNAPSGGSQIGGTYTAAAVGVTNGLFTTNVDFGSVFDGGAAWLAISVRSNGVGNYAALSPLQQITPSPYAQYAPNAGLATNVSGTLALSQLPSVLITNNSANLSVSNLTLTGTIAMNPASDTPVTITTGGNLLMYSDGSYNLFLGLDTGSLSIFENNNSGDYNITGNTAVGATAFRDDFTGSDNTALGHLAVFENETGNNNTGLGATALQYNENGSQNTAVGEAALFYLGFHAQINSGLGGGTNNIALGYQAGYDLTNNESDNIDIGNMGQANESYVIRIGTPGVHTNTILAGVINGDGGGLTNLSVSQLNGLIQTNNLAGFQGNDNVLGGGSGNGILSSALDATLSGGLDNSNHASYSTVGGGESNLVVQVYDTVAGGLENTASGGKSTVGGGEFNIASYLNCTVAGGESNKAAYYQDTVSGGISNTATNRQATVGGGIDNMASGDNSTVPGGSNNIASGQFSFAAGANAQALHTGAFVWSDGSGTSTVSTNTNSVTMRASGGFRFMTSDTGTSTGEYLPAGGGGWVALSDRNSKENFQPVNAGDVLAKVAALPMTSWNYKTEDASVRHIGPMAQDFKASFQVGETDTGICTVDEEGVALAAIQGLNEKLKEKDGEIQDLKQSVADLKKIVQALAEKR